MLVSDLISRPVVCCTPQDTAQTAANLMKIHGVGAIPVVLDRADPLLEGIVTDRDLCCSVVAAAKNANGIEIAELMTRVPVTCEPDDTLEFCEELMQENQVRRIPAVDKRGRCVGIVAQADIALHAPAIQVAKTVTEISKPARVVPQLYFEKGYFYCGQPHETDVILLLNRRRELHKQEEGANMIFTNRTEAGQELARHLSKYANRPDVIVLGVPRGGVTVAFEVATALGVPLDVFVLRKLGVPGHEELAFGAIGGGGVRVLDPDVIESLGLSQLEIELVTSAEKQELKRRERAYRGGRSPLEVRGLNVILVDDGIATGSSIRAAIRALRQMNPARIVVGTPVAPASTCNRLRPEVDELVCVETPEGFRGVGQFYRDFSQVSDEKVNELLDRAAHLFEAQVQDDTEHVSRGAR